jgi:hypothetical protein
MCKGGLLRRILEKIRTRVEYAVFQSTRVTNDAYGWKPKQDDEV